MKRICLCITLAIFLSLPLVCACSAEKQPATDKQQADSKALFEKKCSSCHKADRATSKQKTAAEWTDTVMRMKNKNGAPVSDEEAQQIIDYLAKNYGK